MGIEADDQKKEHSEARKKIEAKIRKTPIRHIENNKVPASAQVVYENIEWYKSFAKLSLFALLFIAVCAVVISVTLAYVMSRPPETLSYLMDEDGRIVKLESIRNPSLTETEVLNWAAKKIKDINSLTFVDYVNHIQSQKADFTKPAFIEYQKALLSSKTLEKVKRDRLVMWAEPEEAPKIIETKVSGGKFTWVVTMRINQFLGGSEYVTNATEMNITMVIQRTSRARNLSGVVVSKYLAKEIGL